MTVSNPAFIGCSDSGDGAERVSWKEKNNSKGCREGEKAKERVLS